MTVPYPPQVPGHPVLGNLPDYRRDPLTFGRRVAKEYGDVVGLRDLVDLPAVPEVAPLAQASTVRVPFEGAGPDVSNAFLTLGAFPMDVAHVDFLAADAHKWLLGPC